ncbi:MAG: hypothetical protein HOE90_24750 [Bacteriovoracaceae bacterium]|nr:hypothetical protein [Bacteriovoracaceae bacterium]
MKKITVALITCFCLSDLFATQWDIALPDFEKNLEEKGVENSFNKNSFDALGKLLATRRERNTMVLNDSSDKEKIKTAKKENQFLKFAQKEIESNPNPAESFIIAKRILYTLDADILEKSKMDLWKKIKKIHNLDTKIHGLKKKKREIPLGDKADKEASDMPKSESEFLNHHELESSTPIEVADLDISKNHPKWNTSKYMKAHPTPWEDLENWVNTQTTKSLWKKNKTLKKKKIKYDLRNSFRVLFYKSMEPRHSSPKLKARDIFGQKWKFKLGNEIQTEPVVNRLYVELGGKYNDLMYTGTKTNKNTITLVLEKNKGEDEEKIKKLTEENATEICSDVATYRLLRACFLLSQYNFLMNHYVLNHGKITASNAEEVLSALPKELTIKKEKYIDREFITFREASVEFSGDVLVKAGPVALSTVHATQSRVARSLALFHFWIWNTDVKDDNSKGYILKNFREKDTYVESDHDMGASLGKPLFTGMINALEVGSDFVEKKGNKFLFHDFIVYQPKKTWKKTTYSDGRWMALKMARLSQDKVEAAVSSTGWPDFQQRALVYKLIARRNALAKAYGIFELVRKNERENPRPTLYKEVSLTVASEYGIDEKVFLEKVKQTEVKLGTKDLVLEKGKINSCKKSFWVNLLEEVNHPSGLERRINRNKDDKPLKECELDLD